MENQRGRVKVYKEDALSHLLGEHDNRMDRTGVSQGSMEPSPRRKPHSRSGEWDSMSFSVADPRSQHTRMSAQSSHQSLRTKQEVIARKHVKFLEMEKQRQRDVNKKMLEYQMQKEAREAQRSRRNQKEIERGRKLMANLDNRLTLAQMSTKSRAEHMHNQWEEAVFKKICEDVNKKVNSTSQQETNIRNREAYQRYLTASNEKGMLFRDIIMESEYDPLTDAAARNIKTKVSGSEDPSRRATMRKKEEDHIMGNASEEFRTKFMLTPTMWGEGIIESTPFGHFTHAHGNEDDAPRKVNIAQASKVHLGQFDIVNDQTFTDKEFHANGRGKRTIFENPYKVDVKVVEQKDYKEPIIFNQD